MLYNPRWKLDKKPPSLEGLIAWLEQQPRDEVYDYCDSETCVAGRYYRSLGHAPQHFISGPSFSIANQMNVPGPLLASVLGDTPWTFGAALERTRKVFG